VIAAGRASAAPLLDRVLAPSMLRWAWRRVRDNRGAAGADGVSLKRFAHTLDAQLLDLEAEVRAGAYRPGHYRRTAFHHHGKRREIVILNVRDRVLQRAAAEVLSPIAERRFLPCSYGYRPGLSLHDAVDDVLRARDRGLLWVVDADIRSCFDRLDHAILMDVVAEVVPDRALRTLIGHWVAGPPRPRGVRRTLGIPQGGVISPLLCNLYLHQLDERVTRRRYHLVRYADDFLVLCRSERHAERALRAVERVLAGMKLELNPVKTRITSFAEGFDFLGVHFTEDDYSYEVAGRRFTIEIDRLPEWFHEHPEEFY
jgi:group II intron reverse transcriptase/maturase